MRGNMPKHFKKDKDTPQVRGRKFESKIAKSMKARTTINSGATFGENDIVGEYFEMEAKLTTKGSFALNAEYLDKVRKKTDIKKIPLLTINFETHGRTYSVLDHEDLMHLISLIEKP